MEQVRILVVEDHPAQRGIMIKMLELSGFACLGASDGGEAVEKAEKELPDLILMDIRMPRMNGLDACRKLKQMQTTKSIPVIFVSAWASGHYRLEAEEAGGIGFFTKPVELARLHEYLGDILHGNRLGIYEED